MNSKEIQDIINFIKKTDLDDVSIETENYKIRVKKNSASISEKVIHKSESPLKIESKEQVIQKEEVELKTEVEKPSSKNLIIKSPMIGTFYQSQNPESNPFVSVGDNIKPGQTICIIEAMKLFNEIESEVSGKVVKILANDSSPVEFDQPLYEIDPS